MEEVEAVVAFVDDGVERTAHELEFLADADAVGVVEPVDSFNQTPVGIKPALGGDAREGNPGLDFVGLRERVGFDRVGAEDKTVVEFAELGAKDLAIHQIEGGVSQGAIEQRAGREWIAIGDESIGGRERPLGDAGGAIGPR